MKFRYEDKLEIYELRKNGVSWPRLSQRYSVNQSSLKYMVRLMNQYGVEIVKTSKNTRYSPELKQEMIDKVLIGSQSQTQVALDYCLPSKAILTNWLSNYSKTDILVLRKQEGDRRKWDANA